MGVHGVQLFGLALVGFGIFDEMGYMDGRHLATSNGTMYLGVFIVFIGIFLDPMIDMWVLPKIKDRKWV